MRTALKVAAMMNGAAGDPTVYIFDDQFKTAEAAPIASPRTAEPGPGTGTVLDTGNKVSISGDKMLIASATVSNSDPAYTAASGITYADGDVWRYLFRLSSAGVSRYIVGLNPYLIISTTIAGGQVGTSVPITTATDYAIFSLSAGGTLFTFARVAGLFVLIGVTTKRVIGNAKAYAGNTGMNLVMDRLSCGRFGATLSDLYYLATDYKATPQANDTILTDADGMVFVKFTTPASGVLDVQVRRTDDDNCWIARFNKDDNTIKLFDKQTGTETERATGAYTMAATKVNYFVVYFDAQTIRVAAGDNNTNDETNRVTYTTAAFNETASGAKISLATTEFISYPRLIPASKLTMPFFT